MVLRRRDDGRLTLGSRPTGVERARNPHCAVRNTSKEAIDKRFALGNVCKMNVEGLAVLAIVLILSGFTMLIVDAVLDED